MLIIVEAGWYVCGRRCALFDSLYFKICLIISMIKSFLKYDGAVWKKEFASVWQRGKMVLKEK